MKEQTKLNAFISELAKEEAGKKQVSVGNIREVLKLLNKKFDGIIYKLIENYKEK